MSPVLTFLGTLYERHSTEQLCWVQDSAVYVWRAHHPLTDLGNSHTTTDEAQQVKLSFGTATI